MERKPNNTRGYYDDYRAQEYHRSGEHRSHSSDYNNTHGSRSSHSSKKKRRWLVPVIIVAAIVVVLAVAGIIGVNYAKDQAKELKAQAYVLKDNLSEAFDNVLAKDPDAAEKSVKKMKETSEEIRETLGSKFWTLVRKFPKYGDDVETVEGLLDTLDDATTEIINPFIEQMRENPISSLKVDGGFNVTVVLSYLDFVDQVAPAIEKVADEVKNVKFNAIDMDFTAYSEKILSLMEKFNILKENEDLIRVILGNGENKYYLVLAQNTAEIRASGGFPGSMGTIVIQDGILSIGHFSSCSDYLPWASPYDVGKTEEEHVLFGDDYLYQDRDANYNAHFAKVSSITQKSCENYIGVHADGVIGMTPHMIQEILAITGDTITLSDGTTMDGTNATKVIDRDLYMNYMGNVDTYLVNEDVVNSLFSETAEKAFSCLTDSFNLENAGSFVEMFRKCFEERYLMVWVEDEADEEVVKAAGASGNLNFDENNPAAGIYLSIRDASRLGMFIAIDYEVSEPTLRSDGCNEYTVTATFTNYLNEIDMSYITNSTYIAGHHDGAINSYVHLFAPAGGTVSDFQTNYGIDVQMGTYENLQVGYWQEVLIYPDNPLVVTYKVTTAAGVTTPLKIESTPTLQDAR